MSDTPRDIVAQLYRSHYSILVAPVIRIMGSFERAEDVVQEAFALALTHWEAKGIPSEPVAWLRTTTKNRAIDKYRRESAWQGKAKELAADELNLLVHPSDLDAVRDDALRLIFTCCHPSLAPASQIALTLRTVCGLTTEEVARSMLLQPTTLQQRIVRAKRKIDIAKIPYIVPTREALPGRLQTALQTIYLVFNEGYGATVGDTLIRRELCEEGIRLARLLVKLLPEQAAPKAVLALMLLHHARRLARTNEGGDLVTLDLQDRGLWDQRLIKEALPIVEECLMANPISNYAIEAAIAALHTSAKSPEDTDWTQISALYALLLERSNQSPVVALNAAVAVAMAGNLEEGLERLEGIEASGALANYHLLSAARGDLLGRLGRVQESRNAYTQALGLVENGVERRFIEARLAKISTGGKEK